MRLSCVLNYALEMFRQILPTLQHLLQLLPVLHHQDVGPAVPGLVLQPGHAGGVVDPHRQTSGQDGGEVGDVPLRSIVTLTREGLSSDGQWRCSSLTQDTDTVVRSKAQLYEGLRHRDHVSLILSVGPAPPHSAPLDCESCPVRNSLDGLLDHPPDGLGRPPRLGPRLEALSDLDWLLGSDRGELEAQDQESKKNEVNFLISFQYSVRPNTKRFTSGMKERSTENLG